MDGMSETNYAQVFCRLIVCNANVGYRFRQTSPTRA